MLNLEPYVLVLRDGYPSPAANAETTAGTTAQGGQETTEGQESGGGGLFQSLFPFLVIGGIFWVLLIGPERKKRKQQEQMRTELKKGDDVMTTGGMFGKITAADEEKVTLQIADGVRVKYLRQAIQGRVGEDLEDGKKLEPEKA